jgi:simple sugar transport system substrate-binding protein
VDVILPICGGASQGVIKSVVNNKIYVTWFDDNGFAKAPGTIISSSVMEQKKMSYNVTKEFIEGSTPWGSAKMVGIKEGFVDFVQDDPNYIKTVPEDIRAKMAPLLADIRAGKIEIKSANNRRTVKKQAVRVDLGSSKEWLRGKLCLPIYI